MSVLFDDFSLNSSLCGMRNFVSSVCDINEKRTVTDKIITLDFVCAKSSWIVIAINGTFFFALVSITLPFRWFCRTTRWIDTACVVYISMFYVKHRKMRETKKFHWTIFAFVCFYTMFISYLVFFGMVLWALYTSRAVSKWFIFYFWRFHCCQSFLSLSNGQTNDIGSHTRYSCSFEITVSVIYYTLNGKK